MKSLLIERLGQQIGVVASRSDEFTDNFALSNQLAHLQVATLYVPRPLARLHVTR